MQVLLIVFLSAVAIQLVFCTAFIVAFARKRNELQGNQAIPVSVIICAHDEEENLRVLIPLLLSQEYPAFEVVIVNDRSNDATFDWLAAEARNDQRIRVVHVNNLPEHVTGKKYALTLGIRAAANDWLLLTDADCRPESTRWISSMSQNFTTEAQFVLGFSPYQKLPGFVNLFTRFESLLAAIQYFSFALLKMPYMGVGRNLAYRKSFFMEKKGFTNLLHIVGGDDDLYVNRHATGDNTRVTLGSKASMRSVPHTTLTGFFRQKTRHLAAGRQYTLKFRVILGAFMLSWIVMWFGAIPLLAVKTMVLWAAGLLALRCVALMVVFGLATRRLEEKFEVWALPLLDFLFSIYYISTGLAALLTKKIRWKKN